MKLKKSTTILIKDIRWNWTFQRLDVLICIKVRDSNVYLLSCQHHISHDQKVKICVQDRQQHDIIL
jgi:hypothetical protein